jgi:metallo-beta-lactamase family protein
MDIFFGGAAQCVTGSQYLISTGKHHLLLDCGKYQESADLYYRNKNFPFIPSKIDAVILTHAHIDHIGNLPTLVKQGFSGPIYSTSATNHLADLFLREIGQMQEENVVEKNIKRTQLNLPLFSPIFSEYDASLVKPHLVNIEYNKPFEPIPGVTAYLDDAGHIIGSASIMLSVQENGIKKNIWYSGDIGPTKSLFVRDPVFPYGLNIDIMIMECTYGHKSARPISDSYEEVSAVMKRTLDRGGKIIIPEHSLGRAQDLIFLLNKLFENHDLPSAPVYIDSPRAKSINEVYSLHPECFPPNTISMFQKNHSAFKMKELQYIQSIEESKELQNRSGPMVIIAPTDKLESGRIISHLKNNIENPNNSYLILSTEMRGPLAQSLMQMANREENINIDGEIYNRRVDIPTVGGLTNHAGQNTLIKYAMSPKRLGKIFLTHGNEKGASYLTEKLDRYKNKIFYPKLYSSIEI